MASPYNVPSHLSASEEQYKRYQSEALEFLKSVLSGDFKKQGGYISPKLVSQIVGSLTPDMMEGFQSRGFNVDPQWMTQYIAPGQVNPEVWGAIQDYALQMAPRAGMESAAGLISQYTLPAGTSNYARTQMEGALAQALRGMEGLAYNPYTGQYQMYDRAVMDQAMRAAQLHANTLLDPTTQQLQGGGGLFGGQGLGSWLNEPKGVSYAGAGGIAQSTPASQGIPQFVGSEPQQVDNPVLTRAMLVSRQQGKQAAMRELLDALAVLQQAP